MVDTVAISEDQQMDGVNTVQLEANHNECFELNESASIIGM